MLVLTNIKSAAKNKNRNWSIHTDSGVPIINLNLTQSSITNKFELVASCIHEMNDRIEGFGSWYESLLLRYIEQDCNSEVILSSVDDFVNFAKQYVDSYKIDYSIFCNSGKSSKTSIMFDVTDIESIVICSVTLKLYSMYWFEDQLRLPPNIHKIVYDKLIQPCIENDVTTKIFKLTKSRVFSFNMTDKYMWDFIRVVLAETPESYVMTVFNYIMNNMIGSLAIDRNPIPFLVSVIDDSVGWLMRNFYKEKFIYKAEFAASDDIYGTVLNKDSFYVYACNDVISKTAKIAMTIFEQEYGLTIDQFDSIRDRLEDVDILNSVSKLLTLPIASRVLKIPYKYLLTCPPKHAALIGFLLYHVAKPMIRTEYPIILKYLPTISRNNNISSVNTKSSYRIRNIGTVLNNDDPVFGFSSKVLKYDVLSSICGVLNSSRRNIVNLIDGKPIKNISISDLETNVTEFYNEFYSGGHGRLFDDMKASIDGYF